MLCKNYPADKRRRTNATPKTIQRLVSAGHPHLKISRADPPAKLETTTQSDSTAGPPFRTPAQQQNNIGPLPASPGNAGISKQKPWPNVGPKAGPSSTTMTQHRAGTGPEPPQQTRKRPANVGTMGILRMYNRSTVTRSTACLIFNMNIIMFSLCTWQ